MFGGAGRIGSKRLDPGAPTTPRPALPAGQGPAGDARASPSLHTESQVDLPATAGVLLFHG